MASKTDAERKVNREWIAHKRATDPEFKESQLKSKRDWYRRNSEQYKKSVNDWRDKNRHRLVAYGRKSKYGITQGEVDAKLASQNNRCAICESESTGWRHGWHLDHDHDHHPGSDKGCKDCVRGLLCQGCNHLLARCKENPEILLAAIQYLAKYKYIKDLPAPTPVASAT